MKIHISDTKNSTGKLLQLINPFNKVAGYKINSQKSIAFLYTNNKMAEKEIRERTPFTVASNTVKYRGDNSNKASERLM